MRGPSGRLTFSNSPTSPGLWSQDQDEDILISGRSVTSARAHHRSPGVPCKHKLFPKSTCAAISSCFSSSHSHSSSPAFQPCVALGLGRFALQGNGRDVACVVERGASSRQAALQRVKRFSSVLDPPSGQPQSLSAPPGRTYSPTPSPGTPPPHQGSQSTLPRSSTQMPYAFAGHSRSH